MCTQPPPINTTAPELTALAIHLFTTSFIKENSFACLLSYRSTWEFVKELSLIVSGRGSEWNVQGHETFCGNFVGL